MAPTDSDAERTGNAGDLFDANTALPIAQLFRDRVERAWIALTRGPGLLALADIEFRPAAATSGPTNLPLVERVLAQRALATLRATDSLAVVGPGRLRLLVPQAGSLSEVHAGVSRLLDAVRGPVPTDQGEVALDFRVGITTGRPPELTVDILLVQAHDATEHAGWNPTTPEIVSFANLPDEANRERSGMGGRVSLRDQVEARPGPAPTKHRLFGL